jgi:tetratricopeptide (TPR) repeat protein
MLVTRAPLAVSLVVAAVASAMPALAAPSGGAATPAATAGEVDTSALRYWAGRNETARVEAEIRRLRALHPGWEPPLDLGRPAIDDERDLWEMFATDRLTELDGEIDRRRASRPGWRPSPDLTEKIHRKRLRAEIVAAADRADWPAVIAAADRDPASFSSDDLDLSWRLAEAAGRTGAGARALDLYRGALATTTGAEERVGTLSRALAVLGPEGIEPLLAMERPGRDGGGEFAGVRLDRARVRLSAWLAGSDTAAFPAAEADRLAAVAAAADGRAEDARLLGWAARRRSDHGGAARWFRTALARARSPEATLGAALSAASLGRPMEALDLAATDLDEPRVAEVYLDVAAAEVAAGRAKGLGSDRLARFRETAERLQSGEAAAVLGWAALRDRHFAEARDWFARAMARRPTVAAAKGHLLALDGLGDRAGSARLAADYRTKFPDLPRPTTAAGRPAAPSTVDCRSGPPRPPRGAEEAIALGWCLMKADRGEEAVAAFEAGRAGGPRLAAEAAYGGALALLRSGRTAEAERIAARSDLPPARRDEIGRIVLAQQAQARFEAGDWTGTLATLDRRRALVDEPTDLSLLRGWALVRLGRAGEARRLFVRLGESAAAPREVAAGLVAAETLELGGKFR